ncbi:N-acetyl-D-glucosamine kinase [Clonorchis sinensis]|uniref:N-acetyl-D-glucosamine kinase n=1 Tax=Clonorchis sinensis TaxID=79923 RepID=A0A3R7JI06_CLOSI|nr:N-acetyl-D-glucosamine kinase [Clonorchis sinensis]
MALIFGGIEGGASNSRIILLNSRGEKIGYAEGPSTNQWLIGLGESVKRLFDLIDAAIHDAHLPPQTPITYLGMALSGVDREDTKKQLLAAMRAVRQDFAGSVQICNDAIGSYLTVTDEPSIVIISGTGSVCKFVREDLTFERVGGYGNLLGDGGGGYYTVHYLLTKFLEIEERLVCWDHDITPVRELIYSHFNIKDSTGLLPHFYESFDKSKIAKLCESMSRAAREGEPLCRKAFRKSGIQLGRHVRACLSRALHPVLPDRCQCGSDASHPSRPSYCRCGSHTTVTKPPAFPKDELLVICCGKVFRSWDLLHEGFRSVFDEDTIPFLQWRGTLKLVKLNTTAGYGAARLVARLNAGIALPIPADATVPLDTIAIDCSELRWSSARHSLKQFQ